MERLISSQDTFGSAAPAIAGDDLDVTQPKAPNLPPKPVEPDAKEGKGKHQQDGAKSSSFKDAVMEEDGFTTTQKILLVGVIVGLFVTFLSIRRRPPQFQKSKSMA